MGKIKLTPARRVPSLRNVVPGLEFWPRSRFVGRTLDLVSYDNEIVPEVLERIAIPDDEVVCDRCNDLIMSDPVPVLATDALCPRCLREATRKLKSPGSSRRS